MKKYFVFVAVLLSVCSASYAQGTQKNNAEKSKLQAEMKKDFLEGCSQTYPEKDCKCLFSKMEKAYSYDELTAIRDSNEVTEKNMNQLKKMAKLCNIDLQ